MPSIANLTLADATPTNHTYVPQSASVGITTLINKEGNIYQGNPKVTLSFSPASQSRSTARAKFQLELPLERQDDAGNYYVAGTARAFVDVVSPSLMTQAEKDDFAALFQSLIADSTVAGYISDDDPMY